MGIGLRVSTLLTTSLVAGAMLGAGLAAPVQAASVEGKDRGHKNPGIARSADDVFGYPGMDITLINHRGLSPGFPENTLAAFANSVEMGVDVIEIDLRPTEDREVVIMHDETVDRTTDGTGSVESLTLAEIKELDAGSYVSPEFADERVPTYEEALGAVEGSDVRLLLDIKDATQVAEIVQITQDLDMVDQVIVGPRTVTALNDFLALEPELETLGFIATPADADAFIAAGVDHIRLWPDWITASRDEPECKADYAARVASYERGEIAHPGSASCVVEAVLSQGIDVWSTVNDAPYEDMDEILALGANGLLSDLPAELDRLIDDVEAKRGPVASTQIERILSGVKHGSRNDGAAAALRRAKKALGSGDRATACNALARAERSAARHADRRHGVKAVYVQEVRRTLACT